MSEGQAVRQAETPATVESLQANFEALGVKKEMVLLVHSSLSALGWVCGGPRRCHHCASGGLGGNWNACDARPFNRSQRSERVEKSACPRIVVANHT